MKSVEPYLNFNGNCEEAFTFYESVFEVKAEFVSKFKDIPEANREHIQADEMNKILHILLPISKNTKLMGSDAPASMKVSAGNNVSLTLNVESEAEARRVFEKLSEGGQVIMPLGKTFWAELYAMFTDKFGIQWMINYSSK